MKLKKFWLTLSIPLLFVCAFAVAASSPVSMLQGVANNMLSQLRQNKGSLTPTTIHRIVNTTLVPYIDINRMAGMVVGRNAWRAASRQQRKVFVSQFKRLVINTYSKALASYNDDKIQIYPLRGGVSGRFARVKSVLIRRSGQKIPMSYNVINRGGQWKIYDFSIEGVSIVRNYRSQFSGTLAEGGMSALIQRLQKYNRGR